MFDAKNDETWAGGDQAATVPLPGGRVLWLFGDTVRGHRLPTGARSADSRMVHNAMLVQTGGCLTAVPATHEVVPSRSDGQWYWPQTAVVRGDELVVLCSRVQRTGAGAFGFRTTGVDAAVFSLKGGMPRFVRMATTPSSSTPESGFQFGAAVVADGPWLDVYGSRQVPGAFGRDVAVARVRPADLLHPKAWQYWSAGRWSHRAPTVVARGWSSAFSVWRDAGGTHALTKLHDVHGRDVVLGAAASATAPFAFRTVADAPSTGGVLRYNPLAHPELRLADGSLLISVCRNSADLRAVWADAALYTPQFAAVRP
jgi:hypothetical protein